MKRVARPGDIYCDLADPLRARDLLERALAIKERAYGPDHDEVANTLTSLGNAECLPAPATHSI